VGLHGGCHGHGRGVGAATAQRGDVALLVDALEAGDDDHLAGIQVGAHALVVDGFDARLGVAAVGADGHLPAGVADGGHAFGLQRNGQQRRRGLLAGGGQHVELAVVGLRGALGRQLLGQASRRLVSPLMALGTTTIWWPARAHLATRLATLRMRSVEPIEVPPYL
jgi:hypothetical protein